MGLDDKGEAEPTASSRRKRLCSSEVTEVRGQRELRFTFCKKGLFVSDDDRSAKDSPGQERWSEADVNITCQEVKEEEEEEEEEEETGCDGKGGRQHTQKEKGGACFYNILVNIHKRKEPQQRPLPPTNGLRIAGNARRGRRRRRRGRGSGRRGGEEALRLAGLGGVRALLLGAGWDVETQDLLHLQGKLLREEGEGPEVRNQRGSAREGPADASSPTLHWVSCRKMDSAPRRTVCRSSFMVSSLMCCGAEG
ncbi:hypothetical protein EYF80_052682 [Liparis tanakae]|uniref:Uncharacterized protein n=1 Tax=Liparis tanakae TaxID=230148 RepID=A0A4Z2F7H8_9TELE|nr:hypothetical protein EYF80_052682 [Liparis tanakae]